jgi:hypothetical protein
MWSEVDFFFHTTAFGCAPNGDRVEWDDWGIGGPPTIATRCWTPPRKKCTDGDLAKIRELQLGPYPAEYVIEALSHLIESDDVSEDAETVFRGSIGEMRQYVLQGNVAKAKEAAERLIREVKREEKRGTITKRAEVVLLASAERFMSTN